MAIDAETIANLSPVKKVILVLVIVVLIFGLYWQLVYRGKARTIDRLRSDLRCWFSWWSTRRIRLYPFFPIVAIP